MFQFILLFSHTPQAALPSAYRNRGDSASGMGPLPVIPQRFPNILWESFIGNGKDFGWCGQHPHHPKSFLHEYHYPILLE